MTKARTLADNFAADINAVTAGTGITGGGTSGTVTVTNSMATAIDAKGDLVVGTGADTFSRLAVASTAGYLLSVDSAEATGLKWAAPAGGGKVLQVVQASTSTAVTFSSTTFTNTGLSGTITPTSASSKILILVNQQLYILAGSGGTLTGSIQLLRGGSVIFQPQSNKQGFGLANAPAGRYDMQGMYPVIYLDSPATTSAITYSLQGACLLTSTQLNFQHDNTGFSTITMLEIGA